VDIFDVATKTWSTARLSAGRAALAATSLPSQGLALFAGGFTGVYFDKTPGQLCSDVVDIFHGKTNTWSTANLVIPRCFLAATSLPLQGLALFAGGEGLFQLLVHTLHLHLSEVQKTMTFYILYVNPNAICFCRRNIHAIALQATVCMMPSTSSTLIQCHGHLLN
jgi:hypothetical protein